MRFLALSLACVFIGSAAAQDETTAPVRPDFSVLTPSMDGRFVVASGADLTAIVPPYLSLGAFSNNARSSELRKLVANERYDPARTLADRLIEALAERGYRAAYEPMTRKAAGSVQSLSWSDLPVSPQGRLILDTNIRWICLCSDVAFSKSYPAISIGWRLLGPHEKVVEPTRVLTYYHYPAWYSKKREEAPDKAAPVPESPYPPVVVSEGCAFDSVKQAAKDPQRLWGCFGEAYDVAVRRLVIDLEKRQPPPTLSASGDTRSGTSR